ncbi:MAG: GNAT family N-acetyltransferase [Bacteroidales bacterium]|nr:GNAT family N-acetyltransferase [Candidatus Latescibacterota bacterium]
MNYRIINIVSDGMVEPYLTQLIGLGAAFYNETTLKDKGLDANAFSLLETIKLLINNDFGILILAIGDNNEVVGTIAGTISPWLLCREQSVCQEAWWYVAKDHRGSGVEHWLLEQFESTAKAAGAQFCIMGTHDNPRERVLLRYYARNGYTSLEHLLIKKV